MSGYVRIHRTLLGHPSFRNESETMAFAWLIAKASWRPIRVRYKGHSISLKRGQLAISVRDFADAHDRNKNWVSRFLKRAIDEDMIQTDAGTGVLVITICNYGQYQGDDDDRGTVRGTHAGTPRGTDAGQTRDTEQEREKGKKRSSVAKATSQRAKFLAPTDVPAETWTDFLHSPKRRKAGMSQTAYAGICRNLIELAEHGFPPGAMIALAVERGWTTVKLEWVLNDNDKRTNGSGRNQPLDGLSSTARAAIAVFGND